MIRIRKPFDMNTIPRYLHFGHARKQAFTLTELLVTVAIIGTLAALLLPALSRAKSQGRNVVCVSQLRQLGVATRLYAEDNNNKLPAAELLPSDPFNPQRPLPRICDVLAPYVGKLGATNSSAPVFKCPADNDWFFEVEESSYQWDTAINGRRMDLGASMGSFWSSGTTTNGETWSTNGTVVQNAVSIPLLLDYDNFHPRPPQSGKNTVYMDGHAATFELAGIALQ
jgi:prepilin-type N-terminal cleavage/methylation domain-containing protein